jgi:hypothetical protein
MRRTHQGASGVCEQIAGRADLNARDRRIKMRKSGAIVVWALCWGAGLTAAGLVGFFAPSHAALALVIASIVGLLLIAGPVRASAIVAGSRHPSTEGLVFGVVCAVAVLTYAFMFGADTGVQASVRRQHPPILDLPPELLAGFLLTVGAAIVGAFAIVRVGVRADARVRRHFQAALMYALSVAGFLVLGLAFLGIAGTFILSLTGPVAIFGDFAHGIVALLVGGVVAGSIAGGLMTSARCRVEERT